MFNIIRKVWTAFDFAEAHVVEGPPRRRLAGGWISDLAALDKAIVLCDLCCRKWKPKNYGYKLQTNVAGQRFVQGACDGCGQWSQCSLFLPERRV